MGIFRSKAVVSAARTATPLTLSERYNVASAMHASAVSVFQGIASQLADSSMEYQAVADDAQAEINRLTTLRDTATDDMVRARDSAVSILDLTRGYRNE